MPRLVTAPQPRTLKQIPVEDERPPFWWIRWVPTTLFFAVVLYLAYVIGRVAVVPVLASAALAYVLNPIVEIFEKRGFSRLWAALLALFVVTVAVAGFLWFVIPDLWDQSVKASESIMRAFTEQNAVKARAYLRGLSPLLDRIIGYRVYSFLRTPNSLIEASQSWAAGSLTDFLVTASSLLDLLLIPFFVFYILVDFTHWRERSEDLIPPRFREPFSRLFDEVGRILQSYVLGQLMIAIIMGVLYAAGFAALGVPAWAGIAALSGFLNVIPYVGNRVRDRACQQSDFRSHRRDVAHLRRTRRVHRSAMCRRLFPHAANPGRSSQPSSDGGLPWTPDWRQVIRLPRCASGGSVHCGRAGIPQVLPRNLQNIGLLPYRRNGS